MSSSDFFDLVTFFLYSSSTLSRFIAFLLTIRFLSFFHAFSRHVLSFIFRFPQHTPVRFIDVVSGGHIEYNAAHAPEGCALKRLCEKIR